jgi:tol-pal system protein YbgF
MGHGIGRGRRVCAFAVALLSAGTTVAAEPAAAPPAVAVAPAQSPETRRLLELLDRLDELEREVRQLRGDLEVTSHDLKGLKDRQRELYLDLDRRLRALEVGGVHQAPAAAPPPPSAPAVPPTATAPAPGNAPTAAPPVPAPSSPAPATAAPSAQEHQAYEAAFNLLKDGRYPQAITAFQQFLKAHPSSGYADNAQYWLGEANYVSRNYKGAASEFGKVLSNYPSSPKIPDAMLKLGFTYYELAKWGEARSTLQEVIKRYPQSTAARLAETRLQRMSKEGH